MSVFEFLGMRFMFVCLTFSILKQPGILVNLFVFMNNWHIIYLGYVLPYDTKAQNNIELANSFLLNMILYCLLLMANLLAGP